MNAAAAVGRWAFASGLLGIGVQQAMLADFSPLLAPGSSELMGRPLWAMLSGLLLVLVSAAILATMRLRLTALILAFMLLADCARLAIPHLLGSPSSGQAWVVVFELIALAGTALIVAAAAPAEPWLASLWNAAIDRLALPGLVCFGMSSIVFGIVHFFYARAIAGLIPPWIPGAVAWAYLVGGARIAGGLSLLTGIRARLAATLMACMYGIWIVVLHLPQVLRAESAAADGTFLLLAIALCGGSLVAAAPVTSVQEITARSI